MKTYEELLRVDSIPVAMNLAKIEEEAPWIYPFFKDKGVIWCGWIVRFTVIFVENGKLWKAICKDFRDFNRTNVVIRNSKIALIEPVTVLGAPKDKNKLKEFLTSGQRFNLSETEWETLANLKRFLEIH